MLIFELSESGLKELPVTQFAASGVRERQDLQRVLRDQIELLSPETLIIAEEFSDWADSRRRIDLLGIDRQANLVVIELKRTEDGGHMELQAIRYAAMVSVITFEKAVEIYGRYLRDRERTDDPAQSLLDFLGWSEPNEQLFGQDVRIVLAAADFSRELTTAVLWLNERDLNIRCVRLRPHSDGSRIFLDIHQIIPLAEASEYLVGLREKVAEVRQSRLREATWRGDWYINLGMDDADSPVKNSQGQNYERHWTFCQRFGYVSAGGHPRYWKPLVTRLNVGDRVWVYQKKAGYVGTGLVSQAAVPIHELQLADGSMLVDRIDRQDINRGCDPDQYAYAVAVDWDQTFPLEEAKHFPGIFANQNIVCKLTNEPTLTFLRREFSLSEQNDAE